MKAKDGTELTPEVLQRLAREAEDGYELDAATPRMAQNVGETPPIAVNRTAGLNLKVRTGNG
jgi:hypothetical protein